MWGLDLTREYSAWEAGLDRFVDLDKGAFVGREALVEQRRAGVPQHFVTLEVDAEDADALGNEPVWQAERMVGRATSGAYGHTLGKSLALAYLEAAVAEPATQLEIEILGARRAATVIPDSPHDPENHRLRA
jgi:dimethylglycine dehydrogenase